MTGGGGGRARKFKDIILEAVSVYGFRVSFLSLCIFRV